MLYYCKAERGEIQHAAHVQIPNITELLNNTVQLFNTGVKNAPNSEQPTILPS